jgi:hypothetical protein
MDQHRKNRYVPFPFSKKASVFGQKASDFWGKTSDFWEKTSDFPQKASAFGGKTSAFWGKVSTDKTKERRNEIKGSFIIYLKTNSYE